MPGISGLSHIAHLRSGAWQSYGKGGLSLGDPLYLW